MTSYINATIIFEKMNDFITFYEPEQLLQLSDTMEIIYSPVLFGIKKVEIGPAAPDVFRRAIKELTRKASGGAAKKMNGEIRLSLKSMSSTQSSGVYFLDVKGSRGGMNILLSLSFSNSGIRTFIETECNAEKDTKEKNHNLSGKSEVEVDAKLPKKKPQLKKAKPDPVKKVSNNSKN